MKTSTGLKYVIIKKNGGKKPSRGTTINIDYTGYLEDGQLFDTSLESEAKIFGKLDPHRRHKMAISQLCFKQDERMV
jgi:peptidylprolyl isomerase